MSISNLGNGKYRVFYYVKDVNTGKLRLRNKTVKGLREAKKFEANVVKTETKVDKGITLEDMYKKYLAGSPACAYTKNQNIKRFEKYVDLKDKTIENITKIELYDWANKLKERGIANYTINSIYGYVKCAYDLANEFYGIPNLAHGIKKLKLYREEKEVLTPDEFIKAVSYESNPIYYAFFYTLYWTGCRRGELKGLYKSDLIEDTLVIKRTMRLNEDSTVDRLKNGDKCKQVKLDKDTLELLIPLAERDGKYLFGDETNLSNSALEWHWKRCMKNAEITKNVTIHGLRHSHGSVLLDAGLDLGSVSKRLGHASVYTTARVYAHALDQSGQKSVEIIDKIKDKK